MATVRIPEQKVKKVCDNIILCVMMAIEAEAPVVAVGSFAVGAVVVVAGAAVVGSLVAVGFFVVIVAVGFSVVVAAADFLVAGAIEGHAAISV